MDQAICLHHESILNPLPPPPGNKTKSMRQLCYESWCRKSHDETSFTPLTNNSRFEHWLVGFKAKLEAYDIDTSTFLDETWPLAALQGYTHDLFIKQCAFFWVLMLEFFKSDLLSSCVRSHSSTRDGQQAYFDFVSLHSKSKAKVYDTLAQLQTLLNLNLDKWKKSKVKFITNWFEELNYLSKLRPPTRPLEYHTVNKQFAKITNPADSNNMSTYIQAEAAVTHQLKITLLLKAAQFEGDFQNYAVFKAGHTPNPTTRLPTAIWKTLSRQGMKGWLNIPVEDKQNLVACLRSELLPDRQPDPNATKPITRKAYTHDHSVTFLDDETSKIDDPNATLEDLHPAVENDCRGVFHKSLGIYKSQTSSVNNQKPLKSSVSPAHPTRFLSENPDICYKKDGNTLVPVGKSSFSVNFHKWYQPKDNQVSVYTYCAHKTSVSTPGFAMVDRGANGCIIGNDVCLISKDIPPRYVNNTGINNHQVQNIPIATCGAYSVSNRGPIILIFNECAYLGRHPSILSSGQMESYFAKVDDTSIKAGSEQVITTTNRDALPLSIRHGLPYLAMCKYTTEEELDTLPHVIMTSNKHWDLSILDTIISPKNEAFLQKYPPQPQQLPYSTYDEYGNPRCIEGLDISVSPSSSTVTSLTFYEVGYKSISNGNLKYISTGLRKHLWHRAGMCRTIYHSQGLIKGKIYKFFTSVKVQPTLPSVQHSLSDFGMTMTQNGPSVPLPISPTTPSQIVHDVFLPPMVRNAIESYMAVSAVQDEDAFPLNNDIDNADDKDDDDVNKNKNNKNNSTNIIDCGDNEEDHTNGADEAFCSHTKQPPPHHLLAELELMNLMARHKSPLNAFKSIFQSRKAIFDNLQSNLGLSDMKFYPHILNWLPDNKPTQVYVCSFKDAIYSLLSDQQLMREENLSFPGYSTTLSPDNPHSLISELHHGSWWKASWKEICNPNSQEILVPIIFYMDGISLDAHGRLTLTPLNMTLLY
eukprot:jgi/Psemu1/14525/gm1.14525_g